MTGIKSRLSSARQKLLRRGSATTTSSSAASTRSRDRALKKSISLSKLPEGSNNPHSSNASSAHDVRLTQSDVLGHLSARPETTSISSTTPAGTSPSLLKDRHDSQAPSTETHDTSVTSASHPKTPDVHVHPGPALTLEAPTPLHPPVQPPPLRSPDVDLNHLDATTEDPAESAEELSELPSQATTTSPPPPAPAIIRRQSLVDPSNAPAITLLDPGIPIVAPSDPSIPLPPVNFSAAMLHRKIWVKRPNASATLVQIREDDLVDDVRDMILRKYGNSLGRSFDAPDILLRIVPRDAHSQTGSKPQDRVLGPEEEMCRTLDAYYPGGQNVTEALIIEIPKPRTPKASPRVPLYYAHHDDSASHHQTEYFPPMPAVVNPSPAAGPHDPRPTHVHAPHSIAVLQTGQIPPLPSPGTTRRHGARPKNTRLNTSSPTTLTGVHHASASARPGSNRPRHDSSASESKHSAVASVPTPPIPVVDPVRQNSTPPTPRVASPRPEKKRKKPKAVEPPSLPAGLLDNSVPPINVLIVEDNIINLRVLGAFMQRLKVRWQRAMNGREAVTKWRAGGFHLVLMDIQLPIMDGLQATREIRRLERVNSIGVFSSGSSEAPNNRLGENGTYRSGEIDEDDKLGEKHLFKSPVIIVALTASSLQSDRHEALAAGCNDFLTKPVNFVWLERKVKEWGCMQALIDFDGWRKWKDFATDSDTTSGTSKLSTSYASIAPRKGKKPASPVQATHPHSNGEAGPSSVNGGATKTKDEEKKGKRRSILVPQPSLPEEEAGVSTPGIESSEGQ